MNYIYTEEEIMTMQQAGLQTGQSALGVVQAVPLPPFNIWSVSGRQAVMQTRNTDAVEGFCQGQAIGKRREGKNVHRTSNIGNRSSMC